MMNLKLNTNLKLKLKLKLRLKVNVDSFIYYKVAYSVILVSTSHNCDHAWGKSCSGRPVRC
jgi:hypothetical protein